MTSERHLLDLLHARLHTDPDGSSIPPRYVLAEHPRTDPANGGRIADAIAVDTWGSGGYSLHGYEVKVTRGDWLRELADPSKAHAWARYCRTWTIVTPPGVVVDDLPPGWGHLVLRPTASRVTLARRVEATPGGTVPLTGAALAGLVRAVAQTTARRASLTGAPAVPPAPEPVTVLPATTAGTTPTPGPVIPSAVSAVRRTPDEDWQTRVAAEEARTAAAARAAAEDAAARAAPSFWPDTCPVWTCTRTDHHTHPERTTRR